MEERIAAETEGKSIDEIQKLNLDNCPSAEIKGLTDEFKNLTSLSLVNVGLTSLTGLPTLPKLVMLNLSDNRLSGELELLHNCPNLVYLNLSGNLIRDVDTLQPLKTLTKLHNLELFNCEVTSTDGYREKTFEMMPSLLYIDGFDKDGQEADADDDDDDDESDEGLAGHNGDHGDDLDDEDDEDDEVGLEYLQKPDLENESDGEEFAPGEGDHEADDLDDEDSEDEPSHGVKRKRDDDEDENGGEGKEAD